MVAGSFALGVYKRAAVRYDCSMDKNVIRPGANPEAMKADLERRRSNAGRPHDSRPRKQRSRRDAKNAAINER